MSYRDEDNGHELFKKDYTETQLEEYKSTYKKFEELLTDNGLEVVGFEWWAWGGITYKVRKQYGNEKYIADFALLSMNESETKPIMYQANYQLLVDAGVDSQHAVLGHLDEFTELIDTVLVNEFESNRNVIINKVIASELKDEYNKNRIF